MWRLLFAAWIGFLPAMLAGCGQSEGPAAAKATVAPANAEPAAEESATIPANLNPQETVIHYLQAVKDGDENQVAALLTATARRKTAEANIAVAPPGSETAEFSVGDMEIIDEDKKTAHVASIWTDQDEEGKPMTLRIVWVVRQDSEGWRIAGMITRLSPKEPVLVLNFEEPEEVVRRNQEEIAKRQTTEPGGQQQTATGPSGDSAPSSSSPAEHPLRHSPATEATASPQSKPGFR